MGLTFTRERYLRKIEAGELVYRTWQPGDMAVRLGEKMALVRYPVTLALDAGHGHGTPFLGWHTDSYELIDGCWQAVWSQATAQRPQTAGA